MRADHFLRLAAAVTFGLTLGLTGFTPRASSQEQKPAADQPAEVGVRGSVGRGAGDGEYIIKVAFGKKKIISYEVAPTSPKKADVAALLGKSVEAKGTMSKGPQGENLFFVTSVAELPR